MVPQLFLRHRIELGEILLDSKFVGCDGIFRQIRVPEIYLKMKDLLSI